jgi:hypothetical protein
LAQPVRHQLLAKQPDCARVGKPVGERQAKRTHEGDAVIDEEFGARVGEIVSRLDDEDVKHRDAIEGWPPALRAVGVAQRHNER